MRRTVFILGTLSLVVALGGCGGGSADRLVEEQITLLDEMADAHESDAPQATIDEIGKRIKENHKQLDDLKLTHAAKKRLVIDHQENLDRATNRLAKAERKRAKGTGGSPVRDATTAPAKK